MSKTTIAITLDEENVDWARKNLNNISKNINEFLENCRERHDDNIEGINIKLEKIYLKKAENKVNYWGAELKTRQQNIIKFEEKQAEKEKKRLENEKNEIEKAESCINCSTKVSAKWFKVGKGKVCKACYMGANAKTMAKWGENGS